METFADPSGDFRGPTVALASTSVSLEFSRQLCDSHYYSAPAKFLRMQVVFSQKVVHMNPNLTSLDGGFWCYASLDVTGL